MTETYVQVLPHLQEKYKLVTDKKLSVKLEFQFPLQSIKLRTNKQ